VVPFHPSSTRRDQRLAPAVKTLLLIAFISPVKTINPVWLTRRPDALQEQLKYPYPD
jgi:hypothetical protein